MDESRSTGHSVATNKVTQAGVMPSWVPAIYGMAVVAPRAEMIRTKYGSSSSGFVHQGQKVTAMPDGDTSATEAIDGATPVNERHAEIEAVEHNAAVGSYDPFEEHHTVAAAMCNRFTQPVAHGSKTVHAKWFKTLTKAEACRRAEVLTKSFDMGETDPVKIEEFNNFSDPQTKYLVDRVWIRHSTTRTTSRVTRLRRSTSPGRKRGRRRQVWSPT